MQGKIERRSNKERTKNTRQALIKAARSLFIEKGYAETSTPEIVKLAAVTRGALYHHFSDKPGLFRAVIEAEAIETGRKIKQDSASADSPLEALMIGAEAYFNAMSVAGRTRLLLIDAPSVLSLEEIKQVEKLAGSEELKEGLQEAIPESRQNDLNLDALTNVLSAAFDRAALEAVDGGSVEDYKQVVFAILRGVMALER